jgi:hypothetical protein
MDRTDAIKHMIGRAQYWHDQCIVAHELNDEAAFDRANELFMALAEQINIKLADA